MEVLDKYNIFLLVKDFYLEFKIITNVQSASQLIAHRLPEKVKQIIKCCTTLYSF